MPTSRNWIPHSRNRSYPWLCQVPAHRSCLVRYQCQYHQSLRHRYFINRSAGAFGGNSSFHPGHCCALQLSLVLRARWPSGLNTTPETSQSSRCWCTSYTIILYSEEYVFFRKGSFDNYDLEAWNDPSRFTPWYRCIRCIPSWRGRVVHGYG